MTINEAIEQIDSSKPNAYTREEKINWLSQIDSLIYNNVILTHEGADEIEFDGYKFDTPGNTKLLVDEPYDEVYYLWMESKIDYLNGEYAKYNNTIMRYNDIFQTYSNWYNRTHMPLTAKIKYM